MQPQMVFPRPFSTTTGVVNSSVTQQKRAARKRKRFTGRNSSISDGELYNSKLTSRPGVNKESKNTIHLLTTVDHGN